jgi:hypothetical protein
VQERLGAELMLSSETLDESLFRELVQSGDHPASLILKAWNTQKIPHRQAVMSFLKDWVQTNALAGNSFEKAVLAGAVDVDASVRELAFGTLSVCRHPELRSLAFEQLRNADPQIRLLGLEHLRKEKPAHALPAVIPLLDGNSSDFASFRAGVQKWKDWWTLHRSDFPPLEIPQLNNPPEPRLRASEFKLRDLTGSSVYLSDFKGKLCF